MHLWVGVILAHITRKGDIVQIERTPLPILQMQRSNSMLFGKNKGSPYKQWKTSAFGVWRGPGRRHSSDDEWEQKFRRPSREDDG